ncbi:serine hydrolase domain-containing protein [Alteromonas facilis]|uniref:serine hydrolase domain-containing protein n=1 Tax=Alteromonas facilis TaxID=2048004 RepID=UPI000C28C8E6|nr:serine hydrolase domain-containing protein [Alteromonas facilis]
MKNVGLLLALVSFQIFASQDAIENGLRAPVAFENESIETYSVYERLAHYKVPAISFALIEKGEIAWAQAYGTTSATSEEKVTVDTAFQAASIAKPVTAFGVMRMKDESIININKDINQYLTSLTLPETEFTIDAKISFKNLLDHTSGLTGGGYQGYVNNSPIPSDVQTFLGQGPATNPATEIEAIPNTQVLYSGAGYTLAEIALSDVFDRPFESIMDEWVLSTLQMKNSSFAMEHPNKPGVQTAMGHDSKGSQIEGGWRRHPEQAAAGLWSTPSDLAKLALEMTNAFNGNSKLLSKASAHEMLTKVLPEQDLAAQFGGHPAMTFVINGENEEFLFKHAGGTFGYRCFLIMYPNTGKGAVFMTNSDAGFSVGLEMLRAASDVHHWPDYKITSYQRRTPNPKEQARFIGTYQFEAGLSVKVIATTKADGMAIVFPNGDVYPLLAIKGNHAYLHTDSGLEVNFDTSSDTPVISLYNQSGRKVQSRTVN